jgi:hypothetical protein
VPPLDTPPEPSAALPATPAADAPAELAEPALPLLPLTEAPPVLVPAADGASLLEHPSPVAKSSATTQPLLRIVPAESLQVFMERESLNYGLDGSLVREKSPCRSICEEPARTPPEA